MRVAFDLHGVLETNMDFFKKILNYLNSIEVHITVLSGPPTDQIISELESLGYTPWYKYFSQILSVVDYLRFESDANMWQDERGNWWTDEPTWWASKGKICKKYKIDILVDDKIQYFESFTKDHPTKFVLLNEENAKEIEDLLSKILLYP